MGMEDPRNAVGRSQTIEFANGEILIGARLHHDNIDTTLGIAWITGR